MSNPLSDIADKITDHYLRFQSAISAFAKEEWKAEEEQGWLDRTMPERTPDSWPFYREGFEAGFMRGLIAANHLNRPKKD